MERPHYHGHRQRLRERFLKSGLAGFGEHEVVELLLTLAMPRADVKQTAKELLNRFGNVRGVPDASLSELRSVAGVGEVASIALQVIRAAATHYLQQSSEAREVLHVLGWEWEMGLYDLMVDAAKTKDVTGVRPGGAVAMLDLSPDEQTWLDEYRRVLRERHAGVVLRMVIYGSKARGDAHADSDLDVLIIVRNDAGALKRTLRDIGYDLAATSWAVPSILAYTQDEWQHRREKGFSFQRAVERDAVAVL